MKPWPLLIGIIVILAIVCSPALAISKSDLIAQYKGQSAPTILTPIPTSTPTPITTGDVNPRVVIRTVDSFYADLSVSSIPTRAMVFLDGSYIGRTPLSIGSKSVGTHQIRVSWPGYEDYSTEVLIPEPICHPIEAVEGIPYASLLDNCEGQSVIIDVTLKKIEIPTIIPKTQYPSLFF